MMKAFLLWIERILLPGRADIRRRREILVIVADDHRRAAVRRQLSRDLDLIAAVDAGQARPVSFTVNGTSWYPEFRRRTLARAKEIFETEAAL